MCRERSLARRRMRRLQCGHFSLVVEVVASRSVSGRDVLQRSVRWMRARGKLSVLV